MLALAPLRTAWFRVELATVGIAADEVKEFRELDVVRVELPQPLEKGELVLSTGARFAVGLAVEGDRWIAKVGERIAHRGPPDQLAINLAFRLCDSKELPAPGMAIVWVVKGEPLVLSWREEIIGHGHLVQVDGESGVRVSSRRRV